MSTWKRTLATARDARDRGDFVTAEIHYHLAAQRAERADPTGMHRAQTYMALAEIADYTNRPSHAESYYGRALRLLERALEIDHPHVVHSLRCLQLTVQALGKKRRVRELELKRRHLLVDVRGFREPMLEFEPRGIQATPFDRQIHWLPEPEVLEPYQRSFEPSSHLGLLGNYYHRRGWFQCAAEMYLAAIAHGETEEEEFSISLATDMENYADLLRLFGRRADAVEMARRAKRIRLS